MATGEEKGFLDSLPHSAIWAGLIAALYAAWRLVQFVFWSEERVSRIASKVFTSNEVLEGFKKIAKAVTEEVLHEHRTLQARLEERIKEMEKRDDERVKTIARLWQQLDANSKEINEVYKFVAERASTGTPLPSRGGHG